VQVGISPCVTSVFPNFLSAESPWLQNIQLEPCVKINKKVNAFCPNGVDLFFKCVLCYFEYIIGVYVHSLQMSFTVANLIVKQIQ
jgi:hypothetical protein